MPMGVDKGQVSPPLKGTAENPARDPKSGGPAGGATVGDMAFKDAVIMVSVCWVLLILLWYSVRHHNV